MWFDYLLLSNRIFYNLKCPSRTIFLGLLKYDWNGILLWKLFLPTVIKYFFCKFLAFSFEFQKVFLITGAIYSTSERSVQFLKHNTFLTCSFWFFRTNVECMSTGDLLIWRNFKFWGTNICYYLLSAPQNWEKDTIACMPSPTI